MSKPVRMQSALKWAFIMSWGPSTIASLLTFVLAMYLGPRDYGLVAIAALYMQFNKMFLENGLGAAIVQKKDLEPEHLDAVFWITLILSFFLMGLAWLLAPVWAAINNDAQEVQTILRTLACLMPIQGLTVVQESLLEKKLDFKSLAIRSNISALVGGLFGLFLAMKGFGWKALVGEDLLGAVLRVTLLWRLGSWRPSFRFSWPHLKELWSFSVFVLIGQIGSFVQRRSDAILIGMFFGSAAVGIYRLADRLINMVIEMATRPFVLVVLPEFSRLQDNVGELRKSVKQCLSASAMLTMPLLAMLAGLSVTICATLSSRGKNWLDAANVIQILALVGAARAVTLFAGPLVQSINRPRMFMAMSWGLAALNVGGFCLAGWALKDGGLLSRFGVPINMHTQAIGVASARAGVFCLIYTPLCLFVMAKICKIPLHEMLRSIAVALIVALSVFSVGMMVDFGLRHIPAHNGWELLAKLIVGATITGALAIGLMFRLEPRVREFILKRFNKKRGGGDKNGKAANGSPVEPQTPRGPANRLPEDVEPPVPEQASAAVDR